MLPRLSFLKPLVTALVALVGLVVVLEVAFRVGGMWMDSRMPEAPSGSTVILAVGDSHTRGQRDPGNYPAQLERLLNDRTGRPYRVINVGVPGLNTLQVKARFARFIDYYRPSLILHWAGINNFWNHAGGEASRSFLARLADGSRVIRFVRVATFYRRLHRENIDAAWPELHDWPGPNARFEVNFAGVEEDIRSAPGPHRPVEEVESMTRDDLTAMMRMARERGIPMYLVTYPFWGGYYQPVNRAIRTVSEDFGLPYIDSVRAVGPAAREAPGEPLFDTWVHPTPILYRHIAEEAFTVLAKQGLVGQPAPTPPE